MSEVAELYTQVGITGVVVFLFAMMIKSLIDKNNEQSEDLEQMKQSFAKQETELNSTYQITIKLIDSINEFKKDVNDKLDRRHEKLVSDIDDATDILQFIKGRINGKGGN